MSKPGRNELCPCGSGRKYKHCHLGVAVPSPGEPGAGAPPPAPAAARMRALIPILSLALVFGVLGALWRGGEGLVVGVVIGVFGGVGLAFMRNPPPPAGKAGGSSINFGR